MHFVTLDFRSLIVIKRQYWLKKSNKMSSTLVLVGLGMAAVGAAGRIALRTMPKAVENMEHVIKNMPQQLDSKAWANSKYYKGGFEDKMSKREVSIVKTLYL